MTRISLTTFNCENLMMRCDFESQRIPQLARKLTRVSDASRAEDVDAVFNVLSEDDRTLTAQALSAAQADVCCLQEVENLVVLTAFHNRYLKRWLRRGYPHKVLKEGNDGRGIDVGLLSRAKIQGVKSHAIRTYEDLAVSPPAGVDPGERVFRRDCLEVDVEKGGKSLTLFICHFKSMNGGRSNTRPIREAEARAVRKLIENRFSSPETENWAAIGDFNDFFELNGTPVDDHALGPLIEDGFAIDALKAFQPDPNERWTHYYAGDDVYAALDHIFLSPALAAKNKEACPRVVRAGQPLRATRAGKRRFPGVGWAHPKASDHCPLSVTLNL